MSAMKDHLADRLEYLRGKIRDESISWGELAELQSLAGYIDSSDVELLEWAGVPEHEDDRSWDWQFGDDEVPE